MQMVHYLECYIKKYMHIIPMDFLKKLPAKESRKKSCGRVSESELLIYTYI